jgi:hypothetical protein
MPKILNKINYLNKCRRNNRDTRPTQTPVYGGFLPMLPDYPAQGADRLSRTAIE